MRRLALLVVILLFAPSPARAGEGRMTLENGLRVTLMPLPTASQTALVVLYDFGELADPEGKSGMAHLMEHLYVTAAAGDLPARSAMEWFRAYPSPYGVNAQTGGDYTVIATVFPPERLDAEIAEAALRMSDLKPTEEILAREKGRLVEELANMFDRNPTLAARNRARELAVSSPEGARKGGAPDQVESISLEAAKERLAKYYRPQNARIVLAGPLPDDTRERIERAFGAVPAGEPAPDARGRVAPRPGEVEEIRAGGLGLVVGSAALPAPAPDDPLYPAFCALAARAMVRSMMGAGGAGAPKFSHAALDEPEIARVHVSVPRGEETKAVVTKLRGYIRDFVIPEGLKESDLPELRRYSTHIFRNLLGPDPRAAAVNPYGAAFGRGRADQMGIDPEDLRKRIDGLTVEELCEAAKKLFPPEKAGIAIVRPK